MPSHLSWEEPALESFPPSCQTTKASLVDQTHAREVIASVVFDPNHYTISKTEGICNQSSKRHVRSELKALKYTFKPVDLTDSK